MRAIAASGSVLCAGLLLAAAGVVAPRTADARPQYCNAFIGHYTNVKAAAQTKCGICHVGNDKKMRNNYGMAFGEGLPGKNCKDEAAIKESLVKAESAKSAVDGKTFGDLLKAGELPASK